MYIHDLNCGWMAHPFLWTRFLLRAEKTIGLIVAAGIQEVYIDTRKGLDEPHAPTMHEISRKQDSEIIDFARAHPPLERKVEISGEMVHARRIHSEARLVVHGILQDVRMGRQVKLEKIHPSIEHLTDSILRNSGALLSLCRIKNKDNYTFLHSVSVGALMVSFCHAQGMEREAMHQAGIGGMLHDIGKMMIPDDILNKPGKLSTMEFSLMKCHVVESRRILEATEGISATAVDVAAQHHERHDGSGYPLGLKGGEISPLGQMAAIVDVYDALTSDRCYHQAIAPTDALRKILEWSRFYFDPALVHVFMRYIGIYPVGTLVRLESGRLGVVVEQNDSDLISPKVRVFFSSKSNTHIRPEVIDLAHGMGSGGGDRIVRHESPKKWNLNPGSFL
ncbi:HD-GYP domain-containing protein [Paludibacterium yongneupense]